MLHTDDLIDGFLQGQRELTLPAGLSLETQKKTLHLHIEKILRLLPGKRLVMQAKLDDERVIVKLFVNARSGERYLQEEVTGYQLVRQAGLPCAELLDQCCSRDGRLSLIVYRYLQDAEDLSSRWGKADDDEKHRWLSQFMQSVLSLHTLGACQHDIHLNNFMCSDDTLFLVDLGSIAPAQKAGPLGRNESLDNLCRFVMQLHVNEQSLVRDSLGWYLRQRGWSVSESELDTRYRKHWRRREKKYLEKCRRDCSAIVYKKTFFREMACRRDWYTEEVANMLARPDVLMASGEILKDGNSSTLVRVRVAGSDVVIKRYNVKNIGHLLRRFFRPTRAWVSWRNAHHLEMIGINTLQPLAFCEERLGPFRYRGYFISAYQPAEELLSHCQSHILSREQLQQVEDIFSMMLQAGISHGDLKAKNLLIDEKSVYLIDLDAMKKWENRRGFLKAFEKDLQRFMKNWQEDNNNQKIFSPVESSILARVEAEACRL